MQRAGEAACRGGLRHRVGIAVASVAHHGMPEVGRVYADLVHTPRVELSAHHGGVLELRQGLEVGAGADRPGIARTRHGHGAAPANPQGGLAGLGRGEMAAQLQQIGALDSMVLERLMDALVGLAADGEQDQARGAPVETMDHAHVRSAHALGLEHANQRVAERAHGALFRGGHGDTGGFVDHEQLRVAVTDLEERGIQRGGGEGLRVDGDSLTWGDAHRRDPNTQGVDVDAAGADEVASAPARDGPRGCPGEPGP